MKLKVSVGALYSFMHGCYLTDPIVPRPLRAGGRASPCRCDLFTLDGQIAVILSVPDKTGFISFDDATKLNIIIQFYDKYVAVTGIFFIMLGPQNIYLN